MYVSPLTYKYKVNIFKVKLKVKDMGVFKSYYFIYISRVPSWKVTPMYIFVGF